jgi:hypothetical protein
MFGKYYAIDLEDESNHLIYEDFGHSLTAKDTLIVDHHADE